MKPEGASAIANEQPRRLTAGELRGLIEACLEDAKAEDLVAIDLAGKTDIADHMVIVSGRSERQVSAMTERLAKALKAVGIETAPLEGIPLCDWVVIDAGDVIIHLFRTEIRALYNLEKVWALAVPREEAFAGA